MPEIYIATSRPGETLTDFAERWAATEAPDAPRQIAWVNPSEATFHLAYGWKTYRVVVDDSGKLWKIIEIRKDGD